MAYEKIIFPISIVSRWICDNVFVLALVSASKPRMYDQKTKQTRQLLLWYMKLTISIIWNESMWDETISYMWWRTQRRSWLPFCGSDRVPFQQKGENLKVSEIKELIFRNLCLFRQTQLWPEIQPTYHFLSYIFNLIWHHNHFPPTATLSSEGT